jgi:glycosyltransferase involved in cell wall biosynthesis
MPKLKVIVTSYNNQDWTETNLDAILNQTYTNYEVLFVDDASTDDTFAIAKYLVGNNDKFTLIRNAENKSKSYAFTEYLPTFVQDEDVILFIDGDDWLSHHDIFEKVAEFYTMHGCWVAYSKFIHFPSLTETQVHGKPYPEMIHRFNLYRTYPFIASHLKTMKGFLLKSIDKNDFIFDGNYVRFGDDVVLMSAAMEMTPTERIMVMDFVAYVYNESESNKERTNADMKSGQLGEDYIRSLRPYAVRKNNSNKLVVPRMLGRLGNQMFEIATAYAFALDNGCQMAVSEQHGVFVSRTGEVSSPKKYESTVFRNIKFIDSLPPSDVWKEPSFAYSPLAYKFDSNLYIEGQFQSEKYFKHRRHEVLELFSPLANVSDYISEKYGTKLKNSVSIHVRRGDYKVSQDSHPLCDIEYYTKALNRIEAHADIHNILLMTDDLLWAQSNFTDTRITFVQEEDYNDLYIMAQCDHNIIANSSFSWWGAWLNTNPNKIVVAPQKWFGPAISHNITDLIPQEWIVI